MAGMSHQFARGILALAQRERSEPHARNGKIGGVRTALRHKGEHSAWGKLGGRRRKVVEPTPITAPRKRKVAR